MVTQFTLEVSGHLPLIDWLLDVAVLHRNVRCARFRMAALPKRLNDGVFFVGIRPLADFPLSKMGFILVLPAWR